MTFYKATRADGTDFHTGQISYEPGRRVRMAPAKKPPHGWEVRTPWVLHASSEPGEALCGGFWPCRLFAAEGRPVCDDGGYTRGFRSLRVVEELDAHLALGPNGAEVAALIERAETLFAKADAWDAAEDAAGYAAGAAARDAAGYAAEDAASATAWVTARLAARDAARDAAGDAAEDAAGYAARLAARLAARDVARLAASAVVVRDLISPEDFDVLMAPWRAAEKAVAV